MNRRSTRAGFGEALLKLAQKDERIVVISADLAESMQVADFAKRYPRRFFEVGVAEQNAIGLAAGLALAGKIPFVCSFASFSPGLNWGQIRQSVCLNGANVKIVGGHAGLATGPDGASHQMLEDVALMRALPGMSVFAPMDYFQAQKITEHLVGRNGPCYLRLTRSETTIWPDHDFRPEKAEILQAGKKLTLVGFGPILAETAFKFKNELKDAEIINCPVLKPFDAETVIASAQKTGRVITIEDHQLVGGLGSIVGESLARAGIGVKFSSIGMDDSFGESAPNFQELWEKYLWSKMNSSLG